jgi:hypothetical protein
MAVGRDHKLEDGKVVPGGVGHDRIQLGIGEAIRHWYGLSSGRDFERIGVEVSIHPDGHFILLPTAVAMRRAKRATTLEKLPAPLSFHRDHQSKLWRRQIAARRETAAQEVARAALQIRRIVGEHHDARGRHIHEADLLRTSGALSTLGVELSPYRMKGYGCPQTHFQFLGLPAYPCPIEIKKRSSGFSYQLVRYVDLPRAVVLCVEHDLVNPPDHVEVVELSSLAEYLGN